MAIPSGAGTEVAWKGTIHNQSTDVTSFRWDRTLPSVGTETDTVPANHIIILMSVIFCEVGGSDVNMTMLTDDGSNAIHIFYNQPIKSNQTFIYNDRLVIRGGRYVKVYTHATDNVDVTYSFIDQDWT